MGGSTSLLHWDLLLEWGSWSSLSVQGRGLETPGLWGWIQVFLFPLKLFLEMPQRGSLDWCLQREQRWGFTFCEGTGGPSTVLSLGVATPWLNKAPGWCWQAPVQARRQQTSPLTLSSLWAVALCLFVAQTGAKSLLLHVKDTGVAQSQHDRAWMSSLPCTWPPLLHHTCLLHLHGGFLVWKMFCLRELLSILSLL